VHLDGYNLVPFFKGETKDAPRIEFLYWNDDGEPVAIRHGEWKAVFKSRTTQVGTSARRSLLICGFPSFSSYSDPFERGESFKEFPMRPKPASFNLDTVKNGEALVDQRLRPNVPLNLRRIRRAHERRG
jgi:arylsulfatase